MTGPAMGIAPACESDTSCPARSTPRPSSSSRPRRGAGRLHGPVDLRPLPPVDRRAGAEPVRLVDDRRAEPGLHAAGDHRGDLPDGADPPGGDRAGRGDQRGAAPAGGSCSASAPARRSTSTSSATRGPRPTSAWRCSRRPWRSCAGCGRRLRLPPRQALHRRERPDLHAARRRRRRSTSPASARRRSSWRRGSATGT